MKRRANAFATLKKWLRDAQIVFHRGDREPWMVTMELTTLLDLLDAPASSTASANLADET